MKAEGILRYVSLSVVLLFFWLALSGHYTGLLISFGVASVAGVAYLSHRMSIVDDEGHPIHLAFGALTYWPWLIIEIMKSAVGVSRIILDPTLPISPSLVTVKPTQKTGVGVNIFANSITLTPGTITIEAKRGELLVHAITKAGADELAEGEMDRRVTRLEGKA